MFSQPSPRPRFPAGRAGCRRMRVRQAVIFSHFHLFIYHTTPRHPKTVTAHSLPFFTSFVHSILHFPPDKHRCTALALGPPHSISQSIPPHVVTHHLATCRHASRYSTEIPTRSAHRHSRRQSGSSARPRGAVVSTIPTAHLSTQTRPPPLTPDRSHPSRLRWRLYRPPFAASTLQTPAYWTLDNLLHQLPTPSLYLQTATVSPQYCTRDSRAESSQSQPSTKVSTQVPHPAQ